MNGPTAAVFLFAYVCETSAVVSDTFTSVTHTHTHTYTLITSFVGILAKKDKLKKAPNRQRSFKIYRKL